MHIAQSRICLYVSSSMEVIAREATTRVVARKMQVIPVHNLPCLLTGFLGLLRVLLLGCCSQFFSFSMNNRHSLHQLLFQVWSHPLYFHLNNHFRIWLDDQNRKAPVIPVVKSRQSMDCKFTSYIPNIFFLQKYFVLSDLYHKIINFVAAYFVLHSGISCTPTLQSERRM